MKKILLLFLVSATSLVSCKFRNSNLEKDVVEVDVNPTALNPYDTLFVEGPAIVFNPFSMDKDIDGKGMDWSNSQATRFTELYTSLFGPYGYKVIATTANNVFFKGDNGKIKPELTSVGTRGARMVVKVPGSNAVIFEKWEDQQGLEKAILGIGL